MGEDRSEHNDGRDPENIIINAADTNDITIYIAGTGTESATVKYLNKGSLATGFTLRPSNTVSIVQIGSKVLRNPITVSTAGFSWNKHLRDFNIIVIRPSVAGINIELLVT